MTAYNLVKICPDANVADDKGSGLPDTRSYRGVSFTDRLTGYLTGTGGLMLKTVDGGLHWKAEDGGTGSAIPQMALANGENGTLVQADGTVKSIRDRAQQIGSRFWYDQLGRLVLSQNAKQFKIKNYLTEDMYKDLVVPAITDPTKKEDETRAYSYTVYDKIGRITEVGELLTQRKLELNKGQDNQVLYSFLTGELLDKTKSVRHQVTNTYYDEPKFANILDKFDQENLRPRVASTTYTETPTDNCQPATGNCYDQATHYSYDVHGNVKTLVQQIACQGTTTNCQLTKRIDYDYDLISGKVNQVYYQKGQPDQFIHSYAYDGDNRLTEVRTSRDGENWDRDAKYEYYAHGPLGRTTIGNAEVETQDLAYTLQGWIKGMKGEHFSYALGYYAGDYASIGTPTAQQAPLAAPVNKGLFNGNIATMTTKFSEAARTQTAIPDVALLTQQFEYDQLNRIKKSTRLTSDGLPNQNANSYATSYTYDGNGNIQSLYRYDMAGAEIDHLSYNYELKSKGYQATTNKLRWVDDNTTAAYAAGAKDQDADNFGYDDIGNLRRDVREGIGRIEWNAYGKVDKVDRISTGDNVNNSRPRLYFDYDASGNRISKTVAQPTGSLASTYYVRDPQGYPLAVYEQINGGLPILAEHGIYGSSRIGLLKISSVTNNIIGEKSYELDDHLGNVSVVLSDKKGVIKGLTGYYPFGMAMGGRNGSIDFRYGFNGQEKEAELNDNVTSAEHWMYDGRYARRWNIDPEWQSLPDATGYSALNNSPISHIDTKGDLAFLLAIPAYEAAVYLVGAAITLYVAHQAIKEAPPLRMPTFKPSPPKEEVKPKPTPKPEAIPKPPVKPVPIGGTKTDPHNTAKPTPKPNPGPKPKPPVLVVPVPEENPEEKITLYRGVSSDYRTPRSRAMYAEAKQGMAIPHGLRDNFTGDAHDNDDLHASGNNNSIFTSWTTDIDVAKKFAMGPNGQYPGIILKKEFKISEVYPNLSPTALRLGEGEWLKPGIVSGADKIKLVKTNP